MANIRLLGPNAIDSAVLTASPALVAALPVSNLQDVSRAKVARTASLATQHVYGNWTQTQALSGMAMVRHNLSSAATFRLRIYAGQNQTGAVVYDSGTVAFATVKAWGELVWGVDPWGAADAFAGWDVRHFAHWFAPVYGLSFDLELADTNTDGYMQASRLVMGLYWEPADNFDRGHLFAWRDSSEQYRTDGGSLRSDARATYRRWSFDLNWLSLGDRSRLANLLRDVGLRKDFFFAAYPGAGGELERDNTALVKVVEMPDIARPYANYWRAKLVMEEA